MSDAPYRTQGVSLRDIMLSLDVESKNAQRRSRGHSAGMAAIRTTWLSVETSYKAAEAGRGTPEYLPRKHQSRRFLEIQPAPREQFPFMVQIPAADRVLPRSLRHNQNLSYHTRTYRNIEPRAVATCPRSHEKEAKTQYMEDFGAGKKLMATFSN
ncbi:hypothetical protein BJ170DRAFT_730832 [Xylariales sp. AK1849]|nr:hypothetical protein BJ170DRAFT_730832 [Xylariales sp. AK1849]